MTEARIVAWVVLSLWLLAGAAACQVPTGVRPSTLTIYGEGGEGDFTGKDRRGGAAIEFEFVYPEPPEEE